MRKKRTDLDFSSHILTTEQRPDLLVHTLAKPNTIIQSFVFINTHDIMAVTGDYGNWIFCREFHPSKSGYVSDHYWLEKLKIGSCQDPYVFDGEVAKQQVLDLLNIPADITNTVEKERLKQLKIFTRDDIVKALLREETLKEEDVEMLKDILTDCTRYSEEEIKYLEQLYQAADDGEYSYIAKAMDRPNSFNTEDIPRGKVMNYHLNFIFDAFDEICSRL